MSAGGHEEQPSDVYNSTSAAVVGPLRAILCACALAGQDAASRTTDADTGVAATRAANVRPAHAVEIF
jgi:hypothetical protein